MCSYGTEPRRRRRPATLGLPAAVVKLVYTRRSGRRALTGVEVRVLSAASECQVHSESTVRAALDLADAHANVSEALKRLGIPRRTASDGLRGAVLHSTDVDAGCTHDATGLSRDYVYLLRLYLRRRRDPRRVHRAEAMTRVTTLTPSCPHARPTTTPATASPSPPRHARPPPGCGHRASASPTRGGCGRFLARDRGRRRDRRPWRAGVRRG